MSSNRQVSITPGPGPARRGSNSSKIGSKAIVDSFGSIQRSISLFKDYGGLGFLYYEKLGHELDKILQVDINMSTAETKGSVRGRSIKLALEMREQGVGEKDIIVICSRKNAEQIIVILATLFLGAIVAPLDPESSNKEKDRLLQKLKPKICFADSRTTTHIQQMLHTMHLDTKVVNFGQEDGGVSEFSKWLHHKEDIQFRPVNIDDPRRTVAFILPTQGTTDFPKLVCLSHDNIALQTMIFEDIFHHPENVLSFFPLFWFFQIVIVCVCLESSATLIIPGPFNERNACKIIQDFNVECLILGTDYARKLFHSSGAKDYNMSCLQAVMIGCNSTTKYDINTLKKASPKTQFLSNYCLVETGCIAATKSRDYLSICLDRPTTVGSLSMNCKVKIVDIHTKEPCPPNKYGEIYYTGDGLMLGYFKDPEGTMAARDKNYFKTGDIGMLDEAGWLYVLGRLEDMIDFDNWSLSPMDIEDVILSHPAIKDVVVVGNAKEVVAIVKIHPESKFSETDVRRHISERLAAKYWPSRILLQEHFPRTAAGSVRRKIIREDILQISIRYSSSMSVIDFDKIED